MVGNFDYNNDEVMRILNNPNYTDEQKKALFEKYKSDLKETRRKEIIDRLNECAKNNPIITQEEYVSFLKKYNDDDLSKPFEVIEQELETFSRQMQDKYDAYMKAKEIQAAPVAPVVQEQAAMVAEEPTPVAQPESEQDIADEIKPDVTPVSYNNDELSDTVFNQAPITTDTVNNLNPTVFEDKEVKEVMPEEMPEALDEKGNASAIIISIIAIIIGMVIMYSIIKLK